MAGLTSLFSLSFQRTLFFCFCLRLCFFSPFIFSILSMGWADCSSCLKKNTKDSNPSTFLKCKNLWKLIFFILINITNAINTLQSYQNLDLPLWLNKKVWPLSFYNYDWIIKLCYILITITAWILVFQKSECNFVIVMIYYFYSLNFSLYTPIFLHRMIYIIFYTFILMC